MAGNGCKEQDMAGMAKMAGKAWKWLEIAGNGWKMLEIFFL